MLFWSLVNDLRDRPKYMIFSNFRSWKGLCVLVLFVAHAVDARIIINELMFYPPPTIPENPDQEWIELYNSGPVGVNLAGWRFDKGIDYTFTNGVVPAGGYLVVAANVESFRTNHPTVSTVVGGWTAKLRNSGETVALVDALGQRADVVTYADEGDWAVRREGEPFPGQPTWWRGWQWLCTAAGGGKTMELMNPAISENTGQNWGSSLLDGGTPGQANSLATNNVPPMIFDLSHYPAVPRSTNSITITSRISDEAPNPTVLLFHRIDGTVAFATTAMSDDGLHGDGLAGDGLFGTVLPPLPDKTIVEFYVSATDSGGRSRTWPGPTDDHGSQQANALYQVDDSTYTGTQPLYRFIIPKSDWNPWLNLMNNIVYGAYSDATMNGAIVRVDGTGTKVRYRVGIRNRGAGTRGANPHNFHLIVPGDNPIEGTTKLNFNTRTVHAQVGGNALFTAAGLLNAYGAAVQVRVNGQNQAYAAPTGSLNSYQFGSYYCFQSYDAQWASEHIPNDSGGNIYAGSWYIDNTKLARGADLEYLGTNIAAYRFGYSPSGPTSTSGPYEKKTNKAEDDWSDLINLTWLLSTNTPQSNYLETISQRVNLDQWLRFFAVNSLVLNMETTLATGAGDDYSAYCGLLDPRFQLLNHDNDTVLGQGDAAPSWTRSIFKAADLPVISRFLKHPDVAPRYFAALKELADSVFTPPEVGRILDEQLQNWVPASYIQSMKDVAERRRTNVLAQIPLRLTAQSSLALSNGFPRTTSPLTSLSGKANGIKTKGILVNGQPAVYSAWEGKWSRSGVALSPGINRVLVQAVDASGAECERVTIDLWYDDNSVFNTGGTVASNTTWTAAGGPYQVISTLTVSNGVTLTIEPGASIYLNPGVNLVVADGGRLLAEGTAVAPIRFTAAPGSTSSWGGIIINGSEGSPETRISHAYFQNNNSTCIQVTAGTLDLSHARFGTTTRQYLSLDGASFRVSQCYFPSATSAFELAHGTGGIKAGGRGIFRNCFFGTANGYNDAIDFTGGNRDLNQPILQFYNNVFMGSGDDLLDLDGTDAWIEGNLFLNNHRNGSPDSASAISGGNAGADTSELTIIGNLFYNCDHAVTAKQGNFYTLLNNTIVRITNTGGEDSAAAVMNLRDEDPTPSTYGAGIYFEGNIVVDATSLVRNYNPAQSVVTMVNNLLPLPWVGTGSGNSTNSPRLAYLPEPAETQFTSWEEAQVLREWFSLQAGSPASGSGPNGQDLGGVISIGASISGEPPSLTSSNSAQLKVGVLRAGNGIPDTGFPLGSGYTHYRWRLNEGAWSGDTPIASPILLSSLADGTYRVDAVGRRDSGWYQDAAELEGPITHSRPWQVDSGLVGLRINEVLARNNLTLVTNGESPDLVELFNAGQYTIDLAEKGLTDDPSIPYKFQFPSGATIAPGHYLVLFAESGPDPSRYTGFGLGQNGDSLYLFHRPGDGGALIDAVHFGPQLVDLSIGRLSSGAWALCKPTPGLPNLMQPVGNPQLLRLNEWFTAGSAALPDDFVELYNQELLPVDMGNLYLSDAPNGTPDRHRITPLSFIAPLGFFAFQADGSTNRGPTHLDFKLRAEMGGVGLFDAKLTVIDRVFYGPQTAGISEGRYPNGSHTMASFLTPTPGSGNPAPQGDVAIVMVSYSLIPLTNTWRFSAEGADLGTSWQSPDYDDSLWASGQALLGVDANTSYPSPILTPLPLTNASGNFITTRYFRTSFQVMTNLAGFTIDTGVFVDDGAVFYLNGGELARLRMPSGTVTFSTLATNQPAEGTRETIAVSAANLSVGLNTLAVEVHQSAIGSSDLVFGLSMTASFTTRITNLNDLVLNEVFAANRSFAHSNGSVTDLVELYNPSSDPITLEGYSLTDDLASPRRWVFPPGARISPGEPLVIRCDPDSPASTEVVPSLNTGFGLDTDGDAVYLFDNSITLKDSIAFGPQAADFSLARVPDASPDWRIALPTPGSENISAETASSAGLRINEWAASVDSGPDWFELFNPAPQPAALGGLYLTDKLNNRTKHLIAPFSFIGVSTNGYVRFVADGETSQGPSHVGFSLDATVGEALGLFPPGTGPAIDTITFGPQTPGWSEGRLPDGADRLAFFSEPSPGEANWLPLIHPVINEVLTHTDLPLEDAVELHNLSDTPVDIGGWYLSDSSRDLFKYRIAEGTTIPAGGYKVFYEFQFDSDPLVRSSFSFSSARGDEVWLTACDVNGIPTGYRSHAAFGPQYNGVSFARIQTSQGIEFAAQSLLTLGTSVTRHSPVSQLSLFRTGEGAPNSAPQVGPVVITEIMYHPPLDGTNNNTLHEFVELHNLTADTIPLYDVAHPTNGWRLRQSIDFDFTTSHSIPPGGFLVMVSFDPASDPTALASFRSQYGPEGVLVGPWSGKLSNSGEAVELRAPDAPQITGEDSGVVPYVVVDRVVYSAMPPWPTDVNGSGLSLQRKVFPGYGNEPLNWVGAPPNVGTSGSIDTDGDGMPDTWEAANGLDRFTPNGTEDEDHDGFTNEEEYWAGTNPKNAGSFLSLDTKAGASGEIEIRFLAAAGRTYSVVYSEALGSGEWQKFADVPAAVTDQHIVITETPAAGQPGRFYRLITPRLP